MKIIYNGYIYESLLINDSMLKYVNNLINKIQNKDYSDFNGNIKTSHGEYTVTTKIIQTDDNIGPQYWPDLDFYSGELLGRIIKVPINPNDLDIVRLKEDLYHEMLHSVDPKVNKLDIMEKPFGAFNYIQPSENNYGEYKNQPIEREVYLTTLAKKAVEGRLKNKGIIATKSDIISGRIIEALVDSKLITNKKEFLKLCYNYFINRTN